MNNRRRKPVKPKTMKKYNYNNDHNTENIASEPAWTYGSSAMQMPMTDDDFELTLEQIRIIDERVERIENGTAKLISQEEFDQEMDLFLMQLKQARIDYAKV
jgi:hypothetical protein